MSISAIPRLPRRRPRRGALAVLISFAVLFLFLPVVLRLAAEWPWFTALGYGRVFATRLLAQLLLAGGIGAVAFAFLYANLRFAQRGVVPNPIQVSLDSGQHVLDVTQLLRRMAWPAALGIALLVAVGAAGGWLRVLQFLHRTPF